MLSRSDKFNYVLASVAAVAILVGGFIGRQAGATEAWMYVSAILIGVGASILGMSAGRIATSVAENKDPGLRRRAEVEATDERNVAISSLAKGKAFDLFGPVFGVLMVVYALTGVALPAFLLLVASYLAVFAFYAFSLVRFQKEM